MQEISKSLFKPQKTPVCARQAKGTKYEEAFIYKKTLNKLCVLCLPWRRQVSFVVLFILLFARGILIFNFC